MHAVLSVTLMWDRFLSAAPNAKLSYIEAFHWYQGVALFKNKLSEPIQHSERDALWATAGLLGAVAFCYIEAETPEEAWPLRPPSSLDLNWLKMSYGRKETSRITQTFRVDSVFKTVALEDPNPVLPSSTGVGLGNLPPTFTKLYELNPTSNEDNNPYYTAVCALAQSLVIDDKLAMILSLLSFIGNISPDYKRLLEVKDPRALLLLAYEYAKVCQYHGTWVLRRATLECQAICIYLERYYRHEYVIQELLHFPKAMCGIAGASVHSTPISSLSQSSPTSAAFEDARSIDFR